MKNIKEHPFFEAIDLATKHEKRAGQWGVGGSGSTRGKFLLALRAAHPFVFDKTTTFEKRMNGRSTAEFENLVEDFSLPFSTSLYLMTKSVPIMGPMSENDGTMVVSTTLGYLMQEISPEIIRVFHVQWYQTPPGDPQEHIKLPVIDEWEIDLRELEKKQELVNRLRSDDREIEKAAEATAEAHLVKETNVLLQFTQSISVKRIGVQRGIKTNVKNKLSASGFTVVKFDSLYHIADKREYDYVESIGDTDTDWEWSGFWKGHWRAFYVYEGGIKIVDKYGRNVVDYSRKGKNRAGEKEVVSGYAWVKEHTKGNKDVAKIKTHYVKSR